MWLLKVRELYEGFKDYFKEAGLLDDLAKILDYINETLMIIEDYRSELHPISARMFVLKNICRVEGFARAYARYVGASTMRTLCDELRGPIGVR